MLVVSAIVLNIQERKKQGDNHCLTPLYNMNLPFCPRFIIQMKLLVLYHCFLTCHCWDQNTVFPTLRSIRSSHCVMSMNEQFLRTSVKYRHKDLDTHNLLYDSKMKTNQMFINYLGFNLFFFNIHNMSKDIKFTNVVPVSKEKGNSQIYIPCSHLFTDKRREMKLLIQINPCNCLIFHKSSNCKTNLWNY